MNMTDNTILITGGGSGIGRGLAEMFHAKGNKVIISGRDEQKLKVVTDANDGVEAIVLDVTDPAAIEAFAEDIRAKYPELNAVIHNAGMMQIETIGDGDIAIAEATIATNLLGTIRLNSALLPMLQAQPRAMVMTVSSGLAFMPIFTNPTYCATKAAIHSYTQSLRYQLKDSNVQVIELIPPYVQTELTGPHQASDPMAMPLQDFIDEVTKLLEDNAGITEVCVERVMRQRTAESSGNYEAAFQQFNDMMAKARA